jgi:hypothetical protein
VSLSKIASECEQFADQCVVLGFVPPHPGDVQRAIKTAAVADPTPPSTAPPDVTKPRPSSRIFSPTSARIPDFSPQEHDIIMGHVIPSKNPLSQHILNRIRERIPGLSVKDIRNYIRLLIQKGEVAAPGA